MRVSRILGAVIWADAANVLDEGEIALHILFICTGNICRSPTAERLAVAYGVEHGLPSFVASSAGTHALRGLPIHPEAALALGSLGGDCSDFAARQINERIVADADLVLTMTRAHRDTVLEHAPHRLRRTFTLTEAAMIASRHDAESLEDLASLRAQIAVDESSDISDPIGHRPEFFGAVARQIAQLLPPILQLCRNGG
ncbi:hypothetical protein JCM12141A_04510 [Mycolicibacterium hodleri]